MLCKERYITKVYEGEAGRPAIIRGAEHLKDFQKERKQSVLFKHKMTDHKNEQVRFKMVITKQFHIQLTRQANKVVRISTRPSHELLNSKSEFNHPPLARVVVDRKKKLA